MAPGAEIAAAEARVARRARVMIGLLEGVGQDKKRAAAKRTALNLDQPCGKMWDYSSVLSAISTGPESWPLALSSRSMNSMIAMGALSPWRKPAFSTRV